MRNLILLLPVALLGSTSALSSPVLQGARAPQGLHVGASCEPGWPPTFGGMQGTNGHVYDLAVFDDGSGSGPVLYAGGSFSLAGGVIAPGLATWNGTGWSAVGGGIGQVRALAVHDDGLGGGPALYAAGVFLSAGGQPANNIARWDGSSWSTLGSGLEGSGATVAGHMAAYDDGSGSGPALYVSGSFQTAGGVPANGLARWDGMGWSAVGGGVIPGGGALAVYDDGMGGGPALYTGGGSIASPAPVWRWDGTSWSSLPGDFNGGFSRIVVHDDGSGAGPALYVGGNFTTIGGAPVNCVAKWDGTSWAPLGSGITATVLDLLSYDDGSGSGPALYACGDFGDAGGAQAARIARWDGSSWSGLPSAVGGLGGIAYCMGAYDDGSGSGPTLYVGGANLKLTPDGMWFIVRREPGSWSELGNPNGPGLNGGVEAAVLFDDGTGNGPELHVGGSFTRAGGGIANRIAKWNGSSWTSLGDGMNNTVLALHVHDDGLGGGPALYAGGNFSTAGTATVNRVARWDGVSWSPLGIGVGPGEVHALATYDDGSGSGPRLYVGGYFQSAGGLPASRIARWDGTSWSSLDGSYMNQRVRALAVHDDGLGGGPALYVGGRFTAIGDMAMSYIARWDGSAWSPLGSGLSAHVQALAVHDAGLGAGPVLYAGGSFTAAGGVNAAHVASWDGSAWSAAGSGQEGEVSALAVYDDGTGRGPALYAGGGRLGSGLAASKLGRWDGSTWSSLGEELNDLVRALVVYDDGTDGGPALAVGGSFRASASGDSYVALHGGCASSGVGQGYCAGDGSAGACPCANPGGPGEGCANTTGSGALLAGEGSASVGANDLVLRSTQLPPARSALLFGGSTAVNGGLGVVLGDGLRCAGGQVVRLGVRDSGPDGSATWGPGVAGDGGYTAGQTARFQVWYRDDSGSVCGTGFNLTHGLAVDLEP